MTTAVRKRQVLTGMRYDRVDLVADGANGHAHIKLVKNRSGAPKVTTVTKAMGQIKCNQCGKMNGKGAQVCRFCGSHNLAKTLVTVTKKTINAKPEPKNDDGANPGDYTFEDEQYDQDNGENGQMTGDSLERSVNKSGFFEVDIRKDDVEDVDNERNEHQKEGEDNDEDIEAMAENKPTGTRPDKRTGYQNTATGANDTTGMTFKARRFRKERPGRNSVDYQDQGSQEVAESAEQMYRSESQPTRQAQERRDSTLSDVFAKARRRRRGGNAEGLDIIDTGNSGIYQRPGVKRNGTNTGHNKTTNRGRTAVAPPGNPNDVGKSLRVRKNKGLPELEAMTLCLGLVENLGRIRKSGRDDLYETAVEDFLDHLNASMDVWTTGNSVNKSKDAAALAQYVADGVNAIIAKASPEAEMSDDASEGADADDVDSKRPKVYSKKSQNAGKDETGVGKSKNVEEDIYKNIHPELAARLQRLDELEELRTEEAYLAKANELRHLPGFNAEKIAKQLRNTYEDMGDEAGDYLFQTLQASATQLKDSAVFKQFGVPGANTITGDKLSDNMAKANAYADSMISKSAEGTTREVLIAEYIRKNGADFYEPAKQVA